MFGLIVLALPSPRPGPIAKQWEGEGSSRRRQRGRQVAAELLREVDRDAGVDAALAVEQLGMVGERHHRAMPDIGMDIEAALAVAPEGDELLRRDVVARQSER